MKEEKKMKDPQNKGARKKLIVIISLFIIILIGCGFLYFGMDGFQFDSAAEDGSLDGLSQAELQELMDKKVDESMLAISINSSPEFEDGKSKGTLRIENSASNRYNMKVKIKTNSDDKEIYYSDAIKPGQVIKEDKLDVELAKGEYDCTATFEAYDTKSNKKVGEAAAVLTIYIKK